MSRILGKKLAKNNTKVVINMTKIDVPYPRFSHFWGGIHSQTPYSYAFVIHSQCWLYCCFFFLGGGGGNGEGFY